jgi:parallel beta-helix repeat protein
MHDYDIAGIEVIGSGLIAEIDRNVVTGRGPTAFGQAGIQFSGGATGSIEENVVTNHVTADFSVSNFVSGNIGVFQAAGNTTIAKNIVGNSNVGIFVGAFPDIGSNNVTVVDNTVFDSDVFAGIFVKGDDNLVEGNTVTNSGLTDSNFVNRGGVFAQGTNNRIQDNTINEAVTGLLVSTGNNLSDNHLFNTVVTQSVFVPQASAESGLASLPQTGVTSPTVLRKRLSR